MKQNTCLHCGRNKPSYCEDCFQKLIADNLRYEIQVKRLNEEIDRLKKGNSNNENK